MSNKDAVVRYVIYPGVGIAGAGNSDTGCFIGPEAPGEVPQPDGGFKDRERVISPVAIIYGSNSG